MDGIAALSSSGVQPVLLPCSVYALGSTRYPAAREMIDSGLAVVLATDFNPGSSPTPSIPMALSLASTHMKMTPAEALWAATAGSARSLKREDVGTIAVGSRADLAVLDAPSHLHLAYRPGVPLARALDPSSH